MATDSTVYRQTSFSTRMSLKVISFVPFCIWSKEKKEIPSFTYFWSKSYLQILQKLNSGIVLFTIIHMTVQIGVSFFFHFLRLWWWNWIETKKKNKKKLISNRFKCLLDEANWHCANCTKQISKRRKLDLKQDENRVWIKRTILFYHPRADRCVGVRCVCVLCIHTLICLLFNIQEHLPYLILNLFLNFISTTILCVCVFNWYPTGGHSSLQLSQLRNQKTNKTTKTLD